MDYKSKAIKEFYEKYNNCPEIGHIVDFLNNKYPYKKKFNFSYEQALAKANDWTKSLNNRKIKDLSSGQVELILDLRDEFSLVRLIDQESKDWECCHMGHCVASYKDHKGIYSIRKEGAPVCTLEIKDDCIKQIKGKANGRVSPKYVKYVLKALEYFDYELSSNAIKNLGYVNIDQEFIKNHFKNYKFKKINNKNYLYTGNQLKLVKPFKEKDVNLLLFFCEYNNCLEAIKLLVENGANINACENRALMFSSYNGYLEVVKFLVENGANIESCNNEALRLSSSNGHLEVVKFLVENGGSNKDYNEALIFSTRNSHLEVVKFLVENSSYLKVYDKILNIAISNGHLEITRYLKKNRDLFL